MQHFSELRSVRLLLFFDYWFFSSIRSLLIFWSFTRRRVSHRPEPLFQQESERKIACTENETDDQTLQKRSEQLTCTRITLHIQKRRRFAHALLPMNIYDESNTCSCGITDSTKKKRSLAVDLFHWIIGQKVSWSLFGHLFWSGWIHSECVCSASTTGTRK